MGLEGNIPRLKSQQHRETVQATPGARFKGEELLELLLKEGYDEESSQKAVKDYLFKRASEGEPIE